MKFRNKKLNIIIRKGLALTLAVSMFGGLLPALPAKAADYTVDISDTIVNNYYNSMISDEYDKDDADKDKDRIVAMSNFLDGLEDSQVRPIPSDSRDVYETDKVVWNPSQKQVD